MSEIEQFKPGDIVLGVSHKELMERDPNTRYISTFGGQDKESAGRAYRVDKVKIESRPGLGQYLSVIELSTGRVCTGKYGIRFKKL